ncbi:hypothetical protein FISHEDRAFT_35884, partial [Fistulina hepatica ATCC 64428]
QKHDWFTATLTGGLCVGLILSYLPQHLRIITAGTSEGFSPWFLLLGCTSSAAGLMNLFVMQFGIIKCCRVFSFLGCLEMTAGVVQVFIQWFMYNVILFLFMVYYPPRLKYRGCTNDVETTRKPAKPLVRTSEWSASIIVSWLTAGHFAVLLGTSLYLLLASHPPPVQSQPLNPRLASWATFLGVSSAFLAAIQYTPQLVHTYRTKLVGALSLLMMMIQSPGAVLMVLSIALRPDTNWTSWITFAVAGMMQGSLLVMCICWKIRQSRLGIDDFGNPLGSESSSCLTRTTSSSGVDVPGLVVEDEEEPRAVHAALTAAIESAVETDLRDGVEEAVPNNDTAEQPDDSAEADEETPLLNTQVRNLDRLSESSWDRWFRKS